MEEWTQKVLHVVDRTIVHCALVGIFVPFHHCMLDPEESPFSIAVKVTSYACFGAIIYDYNLDP